MAIGDRIEIEAFDAAETSPFGKTAPSLFGKIDQQVVGGRR